ncbi:MAG: serine/threonine protein kinase [Thermoanaerobaculia bacterium]
MAQQYGRWVIKRSLSQGGQAHTYLVFDPNEGEDNLYVLKRFLNPNRLQRFENEVKAALKLEHPNLIRQIDFDLSGEKPFIVTEYCPGGTLEDADFKSWSTLDLLQLFRAICQGVAYAHNNRVIHRDLKPANIFLKRDGRTPVVGDFGICFFLDNGERVTLTDEAVGARKYTAPELEDGRTDLIGAQADVYSLGKILYRLMAGRIFDREKHRDPTWNLTGEQVDLPDYKRAELAFVNELLDHSVVQDLGRRFSDANHFRANLDRAIFRIQRHAHTLDLKEPQICNFCGLGQYKDVGNSMLGDEPYGYDEVERFGIRHVDGAKWLILWCNYCGHVETFRIDTIRDKSVWRLS